jgi:hypothetical protein
MYQRDALPQQRGIGAFHALHARSNKSAQFVHVGPTCANRWSSKAEFLSPSIHCFMEMIKVVKR